MSTRSSNSRRNVPTSRSQIAFIRGACTAVRKIVVPLAWKTASNKAVKFEPRSRIRNLSPRAARRESGPDSGPAGRSTRRWEAR
jgi:hypothetical protein